MTGTRLFAGALAALLVPISAAAQQPGLSGYYLNVVTHVAESLLGSAGASDVQRLRVMWNASPGPLRFDAAYEHTLTLRQAGTSVGAQLFTATGTESGGDWLPLDGEIESSERMLWRHRVDRLSVQVDLGASADLIVGRQPVSWATTLFLTPADPFSPFDPADPFREYRGGVDAARFPARLGEDLRPAPRRHQRRKRLEPAGRPGARSRAQQPGHRAYIEATRLRAGLAVEVAPRDLIRDYLLQRVENGNLSRAHESRCVHWLIGLQASDMPPELPQTCSCLQQPPSAGLATPQHPDRGRRGCSPMLAMADRVLALMSGYDAKSMGVVDRHYHAVVERAEWLAWNHLRDGGQLVRVPTYSDCAIQHPAGVEGFDPVRMQVSATVRYALSDSWLLIKGESTRRRRPGLQFPRLAKQLVYGHLRDHFHGKSHCEGCASIKASADGQQGLGSAEVWRRIGTVHHITEVTQSLRSLPVS